MLHIPIYKSILFNTKEEIIGYITRAKSGMAYEIQPLYSPNEEPKEIHADILAIHDQTFMIDSKGEKVFATIDGSQEKIGSKITINGRDGIFDVEYIEGQFKVINEDDITQMFDFPRNRTFTLHKEV